MDTDWKAAHKKETGGVKPELTRGEAIDYARVEVVSEEGDQISPADAGESELHINPLTSYVHGRLGLDV